MRNKEPKVQSTVRLDEDQYHLLKFAAEIQDNLTSSDIVREALGRYFGELVVNNEVFAAEADATSLRAEARASAQRRQRLGLPPIPAIEE